MGTVHDIFIPEEHLPATIISYTVSSQEEIKKHQPVCLYEHSTTTGKATTHTLGFPEQESSDGSASKKIREELISPFEGTIGSILTTVGEKITETGCSILTVREPIIGEEKELESLWDSPCAENSNVPVANGAVSSMPYTLYSLGADPKEVERLARETSDRLLKSRKLSLIVDLDQTIIHTTVDSVVEDWINDKNNANNAAINEIARFTLPDSLTMFYIKLRPGLREFLKEITQLYELHIYTMGSSSYASAVALAIDPKQEYFKEKILSRDESEDMSQKTIQRLFPCDTSMAVIIDDRGDVWKWSPNLIRVKPYEFFEEYDEINESFLSEQEECRPSGDSVFPSDTENRETQSDNKSKVNKNASVRQTIRVESSEINDEPLQEPEERSIPIDNDTELYTLLQVLKDIHHTFYGQWDHLAQDNIRHSNQPDVKNIIAAMKTRVLKNTNIVFSGIIPIDCDPAKSDIWSLARTFGAQCSTNLNNQVTHVVASKPGTAKVNHAHRMPHVLVVKPEWLFDSISHWERQDEKQYLINEIPPIRISFNESSKDEEAGETSINFNVMNEHMLSMDWSDAAREVEEFLGDSDFNTVTSEADSEKEDGEDRNSYRKRTRREFLQPEGKGFVNTEEFEQNGIKRIRALRVRPSPLKHQVNFMEDDVFETQSDALEAHQSDESGNNSSSEAEEVKGEEEEEDDNDFLEDFSREIEEELNRPETPASTV